MEMKSSQTKFGNERIDANKLEQIFESFKLFM